jgi:hypothetical protein
MHWILLVFITDAQGQPLTVAQTYSTEEQCADEGGLLHMGLRSQRPELDVVYTCSPTTPNQVAFVAEGGLS